jgi:hypothetical protein
MTTDLPAPPAAPAGLSNGQITEGELDFARGRERS